MKKTDKMLGGVEPYTRQSQPMALLENGSYPPIPAFTDACDQPKGASRRYPGNQGQFTVLEVDVAKIILSEWGQLRTKRPLGISSSPGYVVRSDIPAECIKAHYHPAKIRDFHHDIPTYINKAVRCDHCPPAPEPAWTGAQIRSQILAPVPSQDFRAYLAE